MISDEKYLLPLFTLEVENTTSVQLLRLCGSRNELVAPMRTTSSCEAPALDGVVPSLTRLPSAPATAGTNDGS